MKKPNDIAEATIEAPAKDIKTLKATNAIDKTDTVKVVDDKVSTPSSMVTKTMEESVDAVIEPQDKSTIKYLSNIKDSKTGEISKPFTIKGKNYQMVRGMNPNKEVVMAVYCHDDLDEAGNNIIHQIQYFEENIAKKALAEETKNNPWAICTASTGREDKEKYERCVMDVKKQHGISETMTEEQYNADNFNSDERDFHDKENLRAAEVPATPVAPAVENPKVKETSHSLNLAEYKHFFVDKSTGKFKKFKTNEELAKAVMGENESYMGLSEFKNFFTGKLFGSRQKAKEVNEVDVADASQNVKTALQKMVQLMNPYIVKLIKPQEKIEFITKLTGMLNLDATATQKLVTALRGSSSTTFKSTTATNATTSTVNESKVIKKSQLEESLIERKVLRTIKVKDIK